MEKITTKTTKNLITRFGTSGGLFIGGIILIIYIGLGFVYWQQGVQQRGLEKQIAQIGAIVAMPMASAEELQDKYDEVNSALAPMTDSDAIEKLVSIAEKSGIDVAENATKFSVPQAKFSSKKVGGGNYQVISFTSIHVSGNYSDVMAFITDLDSGETLETMVLTRVETSQIDLTGETAATMNVDIYTKPE